MTTPLEYIHTKALEIGQGARQEAYGPPHKSFEHIAAVWSAFLGVRIKPAHVPWMMCLYKACRDKHSIDNGIIHSDNALDGSNYAGYALNSQIVTKYREALGSENAPEQLAIFIKELTETFGEELGAQFFHYVQEIYMFE